MRIVILASSIYSETSCAMAVRLAEVGYIPVGALALASVNSAILLRKFAQWGPREAVRYAYSKLIPQTSAAQGRIQNKYLKPWLQRGYHCFRNMREIGKFYRFPVAVCRDQNAAASVARLRTWAPELVVFTGGNILREAVLGVARLGVLNVHLGLLPEVRGMSSPEWSLLSNVPVGVTIHSMDGGIDTGPILRRLEFPDAKRCRSLAELRHRLIAYGIEQIGNIISDLDRGLYAPTPQPDQDIDNQFFVMHEWLQARAAGLLTAATPGAAHEQAHEQA